MTSENNQVRGTANTPSDYSKLDDNELLTLIGTHRDRAALTELYNRYKLPLGRFLQRQLGGSQLVDESYNDVMLAVWQKATQFKGNSKVSTWIFSIAYRSQLANVKKESRHTHGDADDFLDAFMADKLQEIDIQTKTNEKLHAALSELSDDHRSVIELSYFHGYNTCEIADIVACPQNTVKTRLYHARKKLKSVLESDDVVIKVEGDEPALESNLSQANRLSYHDSLFATAEPDYRLH